MSPEQKNEFVEKYLTPIAVLLGAVIIAVAFAFGTGGTGAPTDTGGKASVVDIKNVKTEGSPYLGNANAPVTIAVWFDYQCPFCKKYELETLEQVYKDYVTAGKVKIVYKDFQFLGEDSDTAALFARAVWEANPDRFGDWLIAVMTAQDDEGDRGFGDLASITTLTRTIPGIDTDRVLSLMEKNKATYQAAIEADKAEGSTFGINGTPGSIIGTTVIGGAETYAKVKVLIDAELAK